MEVLSGLSKLILLLALTVAALVAAPLSAQRAPASTPRLFVGGLGGGALGVALGAFAGAWVGSNRCDDDGNPDSCHPMEGLAIGATAGAAVGIPIGVHLANGRRGRILPAVAVSAALAAAGVTAVALTDDGGVARTVAVALPLAQLVSSVWIARR